MGFVDAIKSGYSKYATFSGRASRSEFWYFYLFCALVDLVVEFLSALLPVLRGVGNVLRWVWVYLLLFR